MLHQPYVEHQPGRQLHKPGNAVPRKRSQNPPSGRGDARAEGGRGPVPDGTPCGSPSGSASCIFCFFRIMEALGPPTIWSRGTASLYAPPTALRALRVPTPWAHAPDTRVPVRRFRPFLPRIFPLPVLFSAYGSPSGSRICVPAADRPPEETGFMHIPARAGSHSSWRWDGSRFWSAGFSRCSAGFPRG